MGQVRIDYRSEGRASFVKVDGRRVSPSGDPPSGSITVELPEGKYLVVFGTAGPPGSRYSCVITGPEPTPETIVGEISDTNQALRQRTIHVP